MTQCLLVDEDRNGRREMSALLGGFGFDLSESADADAALQLCRATPPDIVVMTGRVGGMGPADFVKRIRRPGRGKTPIVLVCADGPDTDEIGRAILEGAAECLVRPFDRELLAFKLRQVGLI